jgi:hypothetical protein
MTRETTTPISKAINWNKAQGYSVREVPYSYHENWGYHAQNIFSQGIFASHFGMQQKLADLHALNLSGPNPLSHEFGPVIYFLRTDGIDHSLHQKYLLTHRDNLGIVRISHVEGENPENAKSGANGRKRTVAFNYDIQKNGAPLHSILLEETAVAAGGNDKGIRSVVIELDEKGKPSVITDKRTLSWAEPDGRSHIVEVTFKQDAFPADPVAEHMRYDADVFAGAVSLHEYTPNGITAYPANWILNTIPHDSRLFAI